MDEMTLRREQSVNAPEPPVHERDRSEDPLVLLEEVSARGIRSPGEAMRTLESLDWLRISIERDRARCAFQAWGLSTVIDENVGEAVVGRALFDELHRHAGIAATWPVGNAGVLHCYGYLLSTVRTPFGLKRERWLGVDLARAYGLDDTGFVPWLGDDTLLERATEAAARLLARPAAERRFSVQGRSCHWALSAVSGPAALASAVAPAPGAAPLLITTFPVADAAAVLDDTGTAPRLRWNAV